MFSLLLNMSNKNIIILAFVSLLDYSTCLFTHSFNSKLKNESSFNNFTLVRNGMAPEYFDWREQGAVSPVKDQKWCAACWAFGIAAHLESQYKLNYNKEVLVSEQFLIDCLHSSAACQPGNVIKSLAEISFSLSGVLSEQDYYPYEAEQQSCRWDGNVNKLMVVTGAKRVLPREKDIIDALLRYGPLIAGINSKSMEVYQGGIDEPSDRQCNPQELDHVVLIVGYNAYVNTKTKEAVPYWIIKNSWGTNFGDKGFYYLVRGRNACGIESDINHAFVK